MSFDIESIKQIFSALAMIISVFKQTKELLPDSSQKQKINSVIEKAENDIKTVEIQIAQALGHRICHSHWPSGIMISKDNKNWKCPNCGNEFKHNDNSEHPGRHIKSI